MAKSSLILSLKYRMTKEDFREALRAYARRERRFGRTSDQCANDSIKHNANTNTRI